jgi:hypothetical protein
MLCAYSRLIGNQEEQIQEVGKNPIRRHSWDRDIRKFPQGPRRPASTEHSG